MLSVANPPDPPCPSKAPALNGDEKGRPSKSPSSSPDQADPADGPDEAQHPRFSIRDYVFASRSRDVRTHWPFPQRYLQLCLKHGVRDLLPPVEPPDLVRARSSSWNGKLVPADHLWNACPEVEQTQIEVSDAVKCAFSQPTQEPVVGSSHQPRISPLSVEKTTVLADVYEDELCRAAETESGVTADHDHSRSIPSSVSPFPGSVQETTGTVSESSSGVGVVKPPRLAENFGGTSERSIKKCRLIVKFGGAPESNRTEEAVSSLSSVSDSMASKVCPVCKAFTSSSNTTLNAHIDQCLSSESSAKWDAMKLSQHKVKPRKKRSMEEIYATAARCTLEDLDRRNGTNWALDFSSIRQNSEALCTTERKQPRISPVKATDDEREGAVYVDSNGMKLLILSKFNDAQSAAAGDYCAPKKCRKELKNKSPPFGKRNRLPQKYRKYLKAKVQRKKMSSFSRLKGEVHKECEVNAGAPHEKGMIIEASNAPEQVKVGKPGTLGHWICSKRSSLLKHLNSICGHRKSRIPLAITHTSMESDRSASCDYFATSHNWKFGKSADEILSTSNASNAPVPSIAVLASLDQGENTADLPAKNARSIGNNPSTSNSIVLKLSRSTGKCVSSAKDKRAGMHAYFVQKHGKLQSMRKNSVGCHFQMRKGEKGSRKLILMDEQQCRKEAKCNEVVQGVVSKKLRKHRFAVKPQKAMKDLSSELAEGFHGSPADNLGSTHNKLMSGMHESNLSENVMRRETSNTLEEVSTDSLHQDMTADAIQTDVCYDATDEGEPHTLNQMRIEAECHHAEMTEFDAQIEVPSTMDSMVKHPLEKSTGTCGSKVVTSEDHEATTCDRLDSFLSLEGKASVPKLLGDQRMHYGVIASDVLCQDSCQVGQIESSVKDGYSPEIQNLEDQAVIISSIQGSTACLSTPENEVLGTSVASGSTVATEIHNVIVEGELSGSPVSAASTISHLSMEDLKFKDAEGEPSEDTVVTQETLRPHPRNLRLLVDGSIRIMEGADPENTFQRLKARVSTQDPEGFWDGQPCCCSGRESIPYNYRMLKPSSMAAMTLPTNAKQIASSLYMKPLIPSCGMYSHPTSEGKASPIGDSPTSSSSVKASSDFVGRFPPFGSIGSASLSSHVQPQSTSSPILRLMGKNLMVTNKEERSVEQENQTAPCSSEVTSNGKYISLFGFSSTSSFSNLDGIRYHPQHLDCSMLSGRRPSNVETPFPLPAKRMSSFAGTSLHSALMMNTNSFHHHKWVDEKPNSLAMSNSENVRTLHEGQISTPITRGLIPEREVIVIDDSPEDENEGNCESMQNLPSNMAPPFPGSDLRRVGHFSCYPSLNPCQQGDLGHDLKPGFPISFLRHNTTASKWGSTSGSSGFPLPIHVVPSHSAGQEPATLYHSPNFQ